MEADSVGMCPNQLDRRQRSSWLPAPKLSGRRRTPVIHHSARCVAFLFTAISVLVPARADTPVALTNPGMEPPYNPVNLNSGAISGAIANGWSDNSTWASATVQYSEETSNPHSGMACQKVVVGSVGTGQVQFIQPFGLHAGNIYTASVWLRGTPGLQASLAIQQANSPYAVYIQSSLALTADWQQVTAAGYIATTEPAYLMIAINAPGTLWVDDFALSLCARNLRAHAPHRPDSAVVLRHARGELPAKPTPQQRFRAALCLRRRQQSDLQAISR